MIQTDIIPIADVAEAAASIATDGYAIVETGLSAEGLVRLKSLLAEAIVAEDAWHGSAERMDHSMVLVCPKYSVEFAEVLADPVLWSVVGAVLGEGAIVYAYTSSSMPPLSTNYSSRIHNDCPRNLGDLITNVGVTLPLDEFTEENGATFFLPGSQYRSSSPTADEFFGGAKRLVAPPGTALVFDARLWHAGGPNHTDQWRHALTVNFCRGWMKQRLDLPRMLGEGYRSMVSPRAAQRLGYDSQVPASYHEYYQPAHRRLYRQSPE